MTELEMLQRAKMYIDKLANGIDPITDREVPPDDIIHQVRLARCFFYVSNVLRRTIENGGISQKAEKREKKVPFAVSPEKLSTYEFSENPISASEIARRLTALTENEQMKHMKYSSITNWLAKIGMLSTVELPDGKRTKRPTEVGMETGITVEDRIGSQGKPYQVVVYNREAQHFLIDNLSAILEAENADGAMQGQPWSTLHDECLVDLFSKGVPLGEIAITLKRSTSSIRSRLKKLGVIQKN